MGWKKRLRYRKKATSAPTLSVWWGTMVPPMASMTAWPRMPSIWVPGP